MALILKGMEELSVVLDDLTTMIKVKRHLFMNLESCLAESTRRLDRAFLESKSSELGVILVEFSKRAIAWCDGTGLEMQI